ncbi:MAG TPA: UDP-N-acetylmuramate--L-alanine ligase [Microthrixaceae bacterium]|nr:UDP-N-acetylmuramate--L-alanine ligase [Microthrixaceae bacterium]
MRVHVVGVGGAGMSAIAAVLVGMGHQVSGSDLRDTPALDRLRELGVRVEIGHDAAHLGDAELVTISTAVPATNPEVVAANEAGRPVLRRAEMLASICATRSTVAVAGTHGKTTTSSLLALALRGAGLDPSFIIGGEVPDLDGGAHWGEADLFVVEADESDGTFLELSRHSAIVTNLEPDHLEHYGGFDGLVAAFEQFVVDTPGPVVISADDPLASQLAARVGDSVGRAVVTYGTDEGSDHRIEALEVDRHGSRWTVRGPGGSVEVNLPMPGEHNARNATAAIAMAVELGADLAAAVDALASYRGIARRFEPRGSARGVEFVDDYAHLPTEVRAALATARRGGYRRVVCVFQPHRYSRTEALWRSFADAFDDAEVLVVTDVYSSGEPPRPGITGKLILDAVLDARPHRRAVYLPRREDLVAHLPGMLRPGDLCLTLGAGDLTTLPSALIARLGHDPGTEPT